MAKKPRENRVPIMMSDDELTAIDDWRFANRVATRSDAIRRLCQVGLIAGERLPSVFEGLTSYYSEASDMVTSRLLPDRKIGDAESRLLKEAGRQAQKLEELILQIEAIVLPIQNLSKSGDLDATLQRARETRDAVDRWIAVVRSDNEAKK